MVDPYKRQITAETAEWLQTRETALAGLRAGLQTGSFATAPRDPLAAAEALTPGYPPTAGIQQAYKDVILNPDDLVTGTSAISGLEVQDAMLESARRTAAVLRGSRSAALARMRTMLEDAPRRRDHLEDLILGDDLPVGPPPAVTSAGAVV